ncbi:MAG: C69 family dipeptidase [Planctomycetaceae bacterium]|nr:C69 family dipeptidase [Planctomycetaceae bacterium]
MPPRIACLLLALALTAHTASACTSLLVTKGASEDGAVMITYTADAAGFYPRLIILPAEEHPEGSVIVIPPTDERPTAGAIKQAPKTHHVVGVTWDPEPGFRRGEWLKQGLINEHQLAITESTFGGRPELRNPQGLTSYSMLITLALQRAKTAREAIDVITSLAEEYGYHDTGESFSIADKEEAWVLELIGTGPREPQPQHIESYAVGKRVTDFPANAIDLFSPESTYALGNRIIGGDGENKIERLRQYTAGLTIPDHMEQWVTSMTPEGRSSMLNAEILHVFIYRDKHAMVIAEVVKGETYNNRVFSKRDGHWFNAGGGGLYRGTSADEVVKMNEEAFHRLADGWDRAENSEIRADGRSADPGLVVWVAKKVPDGEISAHANQARIGVIPDVPDRDSFFYSDNIRSFAIEKGWYDPASGEPFRFNYIYDEITAKSKRVCEARVWSMFRRAAPSLDLSPDYHRGVPGAQPYPWSITPDRKLSLYDVFALKRDHYEGTDFDMTKGADAEPFGLPLRWRPLYWHLKNEQGEDDVETEYAWERPISTQQTGFSVVSQSRSWLPDMVGGVLWYGVDDTYTTCYFPLYCQITEVPKPFATGSIEEFSWDSAWWVTNLVANYANLKFDRIAPEIIKVQQKLETRFIMQQGSVDRSVLDHPQGIPVIDVSTGNRVAKVLTAQEFLTSYSMSAGNVVFDRWKQLATEIFTKFNDGYIRADDGTYPREGDPYPDSWLRRVVEERPEQFKLPTE